MKSLLKKNESGSSQMIRVLLMAECMTLTHAIKVHVLYPKPNISQMVERMAEDHRVGSSILSKATMVYWRISKLAAPSMQR